MRRSSYNGAISNRQRLPSAARRVTFFEVELAEAFFACVCTRPRESQSGKHRRLENLRD